MTPAFVDIRCWRQRCTSKNNRKTDLFLSKAQCVEPEKFSRNSDPLNAEYSWLRIPTNGKRFPLLQNSQTGSVAQPASYSVPNVVISWG